MTSAPTPALVTAPSLCVAGPSYRGTERFQEWSPSDASTRGAFDISLSRCAGSEGAKALTADVVARIVPHMKQARKIGAGKLRTLNSDTGHVLAGLLYRAPPDGCPLVVSARRGKAALQWRGAPVKRDAFWGVVDAMIGARLVQTRRGTAFPLFAFRGLPTRLSPTGELRALAARHGVTSTTRASDWPTNMTGITPRLARGARLVVLRDGSRKNGDRKDIPIPSALADEAAAIEARLAHLNDRLAGAHWEPCAVPVLVRIFHGRRFDLHGRFYPIGDGNYLGMERSERAGIRINGEPVAEVDINASQLSVVLGLSGVTKLARSDLYALPGFDRSLVKFFFTRMMGNGAPYKQWPPDKYWPEDMMPDKHRGVPAGRVWDALRSAYPALEALTTILPDAIKRALPRERHAWAAARHIEFRESQVTEAALGYCEARGVVALPVHDALIVPVSKVPIARQALEGAFMALLGVRPNVRGKGPG